MYSSGNKMKEEMVIYSPIFTYLERRGLLQCAADGETYEHFLSDGGNIKWRFLD